MDDEGRRIQDWLEQCATDLAELDRLRARLVPGERAFRGAEHDARTAHARITTEQADVASLESFSPTRIWAALKGSRDTDLSREQAEVQAAEYAAAQADARLAQARTEVEATRAAIAALGDPEQHRAQALADKERWLQHTEGEGAGELAEIATRLGDVRSRLGQVEEALQAADEAGEVLGEAAELLGSARSWATYDTFFDGGLVGDMMKYDRMDDAQRLLQRADQALRRLSTELVDVGLGEVGGVEVTELTRTFDVWFDNIVSDWSVRNRIDEAAERTGSARAAVSDVRRQLVAQRSELAQDLARTTERRESLLSQ